MDKVDYRKGDYRAVADRLRPAAELVVEWCAPQPGHLVVDVAAGSGNVARLCAARAARVVAVDRVREQLLLGRQDADPISWVAWMRLPSRFATAWGTPRCRPPASSSPTGRARRSRSSRGCDEPYRVGRGRVP